MIKPGGTAYHLTHTMGRRSPIRSEASGMIIRSANDVIVSELEKNVVSR